jgi:YidC/Oxa1 family membrane protein insertase
VLLYWFTSNLWTLGQQYYIFRYHPHTPGATPAAVGVPAGEPGRALAPKVGQKPVSPKGNRAGTTPRPGAAAARGGATAAGTPTAASNGTASGARVNLSKPEPGTGQPVDKVSGATSAGGAGTRGQRPNGNRPGNKRSPGKKRR